MGNKTCGIWLGREKGNILSLVVVLLMCMGLLATASMALAKNQLAMAHFSRETSNSYYLARSGVEKVVDSMNKEIAIQLPRLMKEASNTTQGKLLAVDRNNDGVTYSNENNADSYSGEYIGRDLGNRYQIRLKQLIYEHIIDVFVENINEAKLLNYQVYADVKGNKPTEIITKVYYKKSRGIPEDLKKIVGELVSQVDIGQSNKDVFVVEVTAGVKEESNRYLTKSRVVATITLDQITQQDEELLEEYEWAINDISKRDYPQALQSEWVNFGGVVDEIDLSVFSSINEWSYNNPMHIVANSEIVDISKFQQVPTAIIGLNSDTTITLNGIGTFNGIIITPGKVEFRGEVVINGVIIAGNEDTMEMQKSTRGAQIQYDQDMLMKIRCMDKSLQRRLYDCLKITNYKEAGNKKRVETGKEQEKINVIMGEQGSRILRLSPLSVISSNHKGFQFKIKSLQKL